jgi:hypothetical protein
VACPNVQAAAKAVLLIQPSQTAPKGMVLFFSGGGGAKAWDEGTPGAASFLTGLTQQGLEVVQVAWQPRSWLQSSPGESVGPALLACRPASVISWTHENLYQRLKANAPGALTCGFCITGNSGGSSQIAYALTDYGLAGMVDVAVESGGPVHTQIAKGCLGDPLYAYDNLAFTIDVSYGERSGPCTQGDSSFTDTWNRDSVDAPGGDFDYPKTLVVFVLTDPNEPGRTDVHHALAYYDKLKRAGSPHLKLTKIPGLPHEIETSQAGLDAIGSVVLAS